MISRKIATGAVALMSAATLGAAAAPAGATTEKGTAIVIDAAQLVPEADDGGTAADAAKAGVEVAATPMACGSWKRAVGIPLKWSKEIKNGCGLFGRDGLKVTYEWKAERGKPCIKVKGFVKGKTKWYNAGCGASGKIKNVPWGNVLAEKGIKVKGASLFVWR